MLGGARRLKEERFAFAVGNSLLNGYDIGQIIGGYILSAGRNSLGEAQKHKPSRSFRKGKRQEE